MQLQLNCNMIIEAMLSPFCEVFCLCREKEIFPELNDYCDPQPETMLKCTLKQYTCNTRNKTLLQIKKEKTVPFVLQKSTHQAR